MKLDLNLTLYTKINFTWITELNVENKNKDNMEEYLQDLMVKIFLDKTQESLTIKEMMNKFDYIKIGKIFVHQRHH